MTRENCNTRGRDQSLTIFCREGTCGNTLVIGPDDPMPHKWTCPVCADRIDEQLRSAWAEAEMKRLRALEREAVHESF